METVLGAPVVLTFLAVLLAAIGDRVRRRGRDEGSERASCFGLGLMLGGVLPGALAVVSVFVR